MEKRIRSKNFLFCGHDNATKNLAFAYSLTENYKLNDINPYDYWKDLTELIRCKGIDLNSFVHSQWHKYARTAYNKLKTMISQLLYKLLESSFKLKM